MDESSTPQVKLKPTRSAAREVLCASCRVHTLHEGVFVVEPRLSHFREIYESYGQEDSLKAILSGYPACLRSYPVTQQRGSGRTKRAL